MIKSVRAASCMGSPSKQFVTNQVECLNSLLKLEAERDVPVDKLVESIQELVQRHQRNMEWALLNIGPLRLHISMRYFQIHDRWYSIFPDNCKKHIKS